MGSATAYYGLQVTESHTGKGVSGTAAIGNGQTSANLPGTPKGVTFEVTLDSTNDVEIDLTTLLPTITGGSGQTQIESVTIVAPSGITSNGDLSVTITGTRVVGSGVPISVPVTTALTTAAQIATHIKDNAAVVAALIEYTATNSGTATIAVEDNEVRTNDNTFNIAISAGLGVSAVVSSTNTQPGYVATKCERIAGSTYDGKNFEGASPGTPAIFLGIEVTPTDYGIDIAAGSLADSLNPGEAFHKHASGGLANSFTPADTLTLTGQGNGQPTTALVTIVFST